MFLSVVAVVVAIVLAEPSWASITGQEEANQLVSLRHQHLHQFPLHPKLMGCHSMHVFGGSHFAVQDFGTKTACWRRGRTIRNWV